MPFTREDQLVEISERLKAMMTQEATHYVVPDYLAAEWQQKLRDITDTESDDEDGAVAQAATAPSSSTSGRDGNSASA
eukprot:CAMPEP_0201926100 /NCGR_PEP_ID=MMETSP0903-20130614/15274_1 /ASSEMBLY_ACC=CAM_ASM_000552 /TAXON_ID=420261 /ORGANISM="Thalassiosira antarctica, Strain CCMP982" /LENGTH=77 /DNA_ID=CAMNT_0048463847 /DNA_START=71 /DNA_END=300 /DNA_ORIENTATION=+